MDQASTGKQWGYFVGIEKPGRLPAPSRLHKGHETLGPEPPKALLQTFLSAKEANGQPMASHTVADGCLGFGFCSGSGTGDGQPMASQPTTPAASTAEPGEFNPTEVAQILCQKNGWLGPIADTQRRCWTRPSYERRTLC